MQPSHPLISMRRLATHARRTLLTAALLLSACVGGDGPGEPPIEPPPGLPAGVFQLDGIAETLPHTDLEPLRGIIGNARFVALGESTHTSRGYYQAKYRLIRYMVEQLGFRALAFETNWLESQPAARYVASCTGTPEAALASLNGVWHDASVRDMLRWLCQYNAAHPADPVTFIGFDIQEPWFSAPAIEQFVTRAAPSEIARTEPLRRCLGASARNLLDFMQSQQARDLQAGRRDAAAHDACINGIAALESWIDANAGVLAAATSPADVEEARVALIGLRAWEDQLWVADPGGYQARDQGMAQTLLRLQALHAPGRRTIVWAWNWHIARRYEEVRGFNDDPAAHVPRQGARAMGSFLHDALGADYLPIALIAYRIEMIVGATNTPPIPTSTQAVEKRLHDLGRDYLLVDLRQPIPGPLLPPGTWQISQEWGNPYRQFDALLFLDFSPRMEFLGTP
jgi:erythromycin esterase-like protein